LQDFWEGASKREACDFVRPGITGPATLKYRDEEALLAEQDAPRKYNDEVLWPDKVRLNREYVEDWSFLGDLRYIWKTVFGEGKGERGKEQGKRSEGGRRRAVNGMVCLSACHSGLGLFSLVSVRRWYKN
jgi:hypothetical protein